MLELQRHLCALVCATLLVQPALALEPRQVFSKASRSVVVVRTQSAARADVALGSGVVIQPNFVATNCHVLKNAASITIRGGGGPVDAYLFAEDRARDICVLSASTDRMQVAEFADPRSVQPGVRVYSIGAPLGLELTISEGLISGIRETRSGLLIQTSAAISHGSSGGGLFNEEGKLVGFTTFFFGDSQNLNFAIPAQAAVKALEDARRVRAQEESAAAVAAQTFNERTEALIASMRVAFRIFGDAPLTPEPSFDTMDGRLAYLRWLGEMSSRLKARSHDFDDLFNRVELLKMVWYESKRAGLDTSVVLGLIDTGSSFVQAKTNAAGSRGYMQVSPTWLTLIGEHNPPVLSQSRLNLRLGCSLLRYFLDLENGDMYEALTRYHGQMLGSQYRIVDRSTQDFIASVFGAQRRWRYANDQAWAGPDSSKKAVPAR